MTTNANGVVQGPSPAGIPHFRVPFAIGGTGAVQTIQQGTLTEITQSVANLMGTRLGTRLMVPKYGTPDPTFGGVNPPALRVAVAKWEPRAQITTQVTPGNDETATVLVGAAVQP